MQPKLDAIAILLGTWYLAKKVNGTIDDAAWFTWAIGVMVLFSAVRLGRWATRKLADRTQERER